MQLDDEETFVRHGVEVAVEAVDDDDLGVVFGDGGADGVHEFAGREFGRVDLAHPDVARVDVGAQFHAHARAAGAQGADAFVEDEQRRALAASGGGNGELHGHRGLAGAGRADKQGAGAFFDAAAEQVVECLQAAGNTGLGERHHMFGGDQAGVHLQAAAHYSVIVVAAAELLAAELDDDQPAPGGAVVGVVLLQADDGVGDALHLQVVLHGGHVVEQQHGALAAGEELLERQDLAPVAQGAAGQQPQFGQRVEDHPRGFYLVDVGQDLEGGFAELDLGRVEHGVLLVGLERVGRGQHFTHLYACQVPAVRAGHAQQFVCRFGQGDVHDRFALGRALAQELHGDGGLAGAGGAFQQVEPIGGEAAAQDVVEAGDADLQEPGLLELVGWWGKGGHFRAPYGTFTGCVRL